MFLRNCLPAAVFGLYILTGSCSVLKKNSKPVPVVMPEIEVSANDPLDLYRAAATREWELIHTGIDIRFNLKERSADAITCIILHPYYYATDSVTFDAKGMHLIGVTDDQHNPLPFQYDTLKL